MHAGVLEAIMPVLLLAACVAALAGLLLLMGNLFNPRRPGPVKRMPYESGMDPIHDTRRRLNVHFHLVAIAFLVFDVELLFLYPWAVVFRPQGAAAVARQQPAAPAASDLLPAAGRGAASQPDAVWPGGRPRFVFAGGMVFVGLLVLGLVYDWRKGVFQWR